MDTRLFIMTDLEGVAGVISGKDYLYPTGRYYETARRLLTEEVNAAIAGFAAAGFDDFRPLKFAPPYHMHQATRPYRGEPACTKQWEHPDSVIAMLRATAGG